LWHRWRSRFASHSPTRRCVFAVGSLQHPNRGRRAERISRWDPYSGDIRAAARGTSRGSRL